MAELFPEVFANNEQLMLHSCSVAFQKNLFWQEQPLAIVPLLNGTELQVRLQVFVDAFQVWPV